MSFQFIQTPIDGLKIIIPHQAYDVRGLYKKCYEKNIFNLNGIMDVFTEQSVIYSCKGTIRGLHYQSTESQAKLIQVIAGSIYDVAVDLRKGSKTFGKAYEILLKDSEHKCIYIPSGFAHGFQALEENTVFSYLCSGRYVPETCGGILWNDVTLGINWPIKNIDDVILSEKDRIAQTFNEYCIRYGM